MDALDGNAIAGALFDHFGVEMTGRRRGIDLVHGGVAIRERRRCDPDRERHGRGKGCSN